MTETLNLHATSVAIDGRAVLILGAPGRGKSDLALRLVDRGALLVADDRTLVADDGDRLLASAPATIAGMIEVRGLGIVTLPTLDRAPVAAVIDLDAVPDRMPEPCARDLMGRALPLLALDPFEASAPIKVEMFVRAAS